jgi:L-fucose isomerase
MANNELKINNNYQTVIGDFPKVGIRPVIDGRMNGVRESLEDQTMNMAKNAAKLISSTLKYPNGKAVECVIADTCIGGVAEAAMCADKFSKNGIGVSLTVTPCWCYGSETIDMNPEIPKAIWGFNGTERPQICKGRTGYCLYERQILPLHGSSVDGYCRINCQGRFLPGISGDEKRIH